MDIDILSCTNNHSDIHEIYESAKKAQSDYEKEMREASNQLKAEWDRMAIVLKEYHFLNQPYKDVLYHTTIMKFEYEQRANGKNGITLVTENLFHGESWCYKKKAEALDILTEKVRNALNNREQFLREKREIES